MGGIAVRGLSPSERVEEEALDGCGNGNIREDVVGVIEDASGWTVRWVVFTWYVLSAEVKLPREGLYEVVDVFEDFIGSSVLRSSPVRSFS